MNTTSNVGIELPAKYRQLYQRALDGRSRRAAIRAHCLMCCGWQAVEVELCTAPECPLFPFRMGDVSRKES